MDESKAPRADVPAMLREMRHEECRCVTASDVGVPATGNPLVYGECPACSLVGLLADYAAAADALLDVSRISERVCTRVLDVVTYAGGRDWTAVQQMADEIKRVRKTCAALTAARAALAKALEGGEG